MRLVLACLLALPLVLLADDKHHKKTDPDKDTPPPREEPPKQAAGPNTMRLVLKDSSTLMGVLPLESVQIETAYGVLTVPTKDIQRLRIGKQSDPDLLALIQGYVKDLGSDDSNARQKAQESLAKLGRAAEAELKVAAKSSDPEVKNRASNLLSEIQNAAEEDEQALPEEDEMVTVRFTVKGSLKLDKIDLTTPFGVLSIPKKELRVISFERSASEQKKFELQVDATPNAPLSTKIFVHKGDRITVKAEGSLNFRNGNCEFTPEGNPQYGNYPNNGNFPMGSLLGRIGGGSWFKVGSKWSGKASKDGVFFLAIGLEPSYARMTSGSFEVSVESNPGGD